MKVYVTGETGFIGKHVVQILLAQGHELVQPEDRPNAMIHLAWRGLHDYESPDQMENVGWQFKLIEMLAQLGTTNITVPGTCWETCPNPPFYVQAKLALYEKLKCLSVTLKWVRAPYLYGEGQHEGCLLPALHRAVTTGQEEFHVVPGSLPFMYVEDFAERLCAAMLDDRPQVANVPGAVENVADFCRARVPDEKAIKFIADYPVREWER